MSASLEWLNSFDPIFGGTPDLVIDVRPDLEFLPEFDYPDGFPAAKMITISDARQIPGHAVEALKEMVSGDFSFAFINLFVVPPNSISRSLNGSQVKDSSALIVEILNTSVAGRRFALLIPAWLLIDSATSGLREFIATTSSVEAIVYLGSEASRSVGVGDEFDLGLLVIRKRSMPADEVEVLRLLDLKNDPLESWRTFAGRSAKVGGGESVNSVVVREPELGSFAWTKERFSREYGPFIDDVSELGTIATLDEFVSDLRVGIKRSAEMGAVPATDSAAANSDDFISCVGAQTGKARSGLLNTACFVRRDAIAKEHLLRQGDILLRASFASGEGTSSTVVGEVKAADLPSTFDDSCIRLRFRKDIAPELRELIVGYLDSSHAHRWFCVNGATDMLTARLLRDLKVPKPSDELMAALSELRSAERQYREWADEAAAARQGFFSANSYAADLATLMNNSRIEAERLKSARDSETFGYQIRNYYPHPLALRWERIVQSEPGRKQIGEVLECAEHLVVLLGVIGLLQRSLDENEKNPAFARLPQFFVNKILTMDWGKAITVLLDALAYTKKSANPLLLAVPELLEVADEVLDEKSEWRKAEKVLRDQRNDESHLVRVPGSALGELSRSLVANLETLLERTPIVRAVPLVYVADYRLDNLTGNRVAAFDLLQGVSPVFSRIERSVDEEISRGDVGLLTNYGGFVSAFPWLKLDPCGECKRPELFIFNRLSEKSVKFVAMESGHAQVYEELSERLSELVIGKD